MADIERSSDYPHKLLHNDRWYIPVAEHEAEVKRLREALQRILDHGKTHDEPCWALHNGDCADVFQEIARGALDG